MSDTAPPQRAESWVASATPTQVDTAYRRGELHTFLGGRLDEAGWPVDDKGRRIDWETPR